MTTTFTDNVHMAGTTTIVDLDANASIANADIASNAAIAATKLEGQFGVTAELAESSTNVAAVTRLVHIVHGATGEIVDVEAAIMAAMTTDRTVTVDVHKSTGGGAFATVFTTAIALDDSTVVRTATGGTLDSTKTDLVAGDILEVIVTLGGTGGTLAQGLVATLTLREDPA
jgi:hypothetical protein